MKTWTFAAIALGAGALLQVPTQDQDPTPVQTRDPIQDPVLTR